jgi:hypothetical protein
MAMSRECPTCASPNYVEGRLALSGTDDGWVTSFFPKGIKFLSFRKSVNLANGQLFFACLACGHIWSQVVPTELRELLLKNGDASTIAKVQAAAESK